MLALPDFAIIGAPKCGTTSLATWLGEHPHVFMSPIKEPNYFCFDAPMRRSCSTPDSYRALFAGAQPWQACGEASTSYLFSTDAVPAILEAQPRAKVIVMVRNPLDMVVSYHAQKLYSLQEEETEFERAWRLSSARANGRAIAVRNHVPRYLDYRAIGRLGEQVRRLKAKVPARQLHIIVFDDLRVDPQAEYQRALAFLGLPDDARREFPALNGRKSRSWPQLARFAKYPPPPLDRLKQAVRQALPGPVRAIGRRLRAANTRPAQRAQLSEPLQLEMVDAFRDDVILLSELLGRDLRHWLALH
jgi:hypothetical protein